MDWIIFENHQYLVINLQEYINNNIEVIKLFLDTLNEFKKCPIFCNYYTELKYIKQ